MHGSDLSMQRRYSSDEEAEQQLEQIGRDIQEEEANIEQDNAALRVLDTKKINLGLQNQHIQNLRDDLGKKFDKQDVEAILKQMRKDTQHERDLHNAGWQRCTISTHCKACGKHADLTFETFQKNDRALSPHRAFGCASHPLCPALGRSAAEWMARQNLSSRSVSKKDMDKYMEEIAQNGDQIEWHEAEIVAKRLTKQRSERFVENYRETGRVLSNTYTRKKEYRDKSENLERQIEAQMEAQRREKRKMATDMVRLAMPLDAVAKVMSLSVSELQAFISDPRYHSDEDFVTIN